MTGSGTYCTVGQVFDFLNLWSEVLPSSLEAVGTGDNTTTTFYLDHDRVVYDSEVVYVAATAKTQGTHYNMNDDTGAITFTAGNIPTTGQAITASYKYSQYLASSVMDRYIQRAEKKIDQRIGVSFGTETAITEFIDGTGNIDTLAYPFSQQYFTNQVKEIWLDFNVSSNSDRLFKLSKFPVISINLVAIGVGKDQEGSYILAGIGIASARGTHLHYFYPGHGKNGLRKNIYCWHLKHLTPPR